MKGAYRGVRARRVQEGRRGAEAVPIVSADASTRGETACVRGIGVGYGGLFRQRIAACGRESMLRRCAACLNRGTHARPMVESRPPCCRGDEIGKHSGLKRLSARPETVGAEPFKFGETPDARIEATPSQALRAPRGRCRD